MLQHVNMTVLGLAVGALLILILLRRWAWLILLPPGAALLVYAILHTIWGGQRY